MNNGGIKRLADRPFDEFRYDSDAGNFPNLRGHHQPNVERERALDLFRLDEIRELTPYQDWQGRCADSKPSRFNVAVQCRQ